jgi:hypothetical protein
MGKVSRLLKKFADIRLSRLDKRLIKGFYVTEEAELVNDSEVNEQKYMSQSNFHHTKTVLKNVRHSNAQQNARI